MGAVIIQPFYYGDFMQRIYKWGKYILGLFVLIIVFAFSSDKCYAEEYIIVLDPGHGGEALGGQTEEYIEQEINLITAKSMYERLSQYEGVTVYLTHDEIGEADISRTDRAKIAFEYDADYLFSLHYNMSANHNLYGTEVWTSAFGNEYGFGQTIGNIITNDISSEFGLFNRGVKVRLNKKRDDYYGIIQMCRKEGIPAIIIEHCHLDSEKDRAVLGSISDIFVKFGEADADAVAKYLGLKSSSLGIDYSDYQYDVVSGSEFNPPDESEPEYVNVRINSSDIYEGTCNITIDADDSDGRMQYYAISMDGGNTFGEMLPWSNDMSALCPEAVGEINTDIDLIPGRESRLVVRGYNQYELYTDSSVNLLPAGFIEPEPEEESLTAGNDKENGDDRDISDAGMKEIVINPSDDNSVSPVIAIALLIGGVAVTIIIIAAYNITFYGSKGQRKRRRRRRGRRY